MSKPIVIKSTSGVTYHGTIDRENNVECDDVRHEVVDGIEEQAANCQASGKVEVGGQTFAWAIEEPETVYVVRDASGEYLRDLNGGRTPASNEAYEFETREEAKSRCVRATDKVLSREVE